MVDCATLRKAATSWVVHQSSGRDSATGFRLQRSRCLTTYGALGPDDCHRSAALSRPIDDIGCAAISPRGLAVPDGKEPVCAVQHGVAGFQRLVTETRNSKTSRGTPPSASTLRHVYKLI